MIVTHLHPQIPLQSGNPIRVCYQIIAPMSIINLASAEGGPRSSGCLHGCLPSSSQSQLSSHKRQLRRALMSQTADLVPFEVWFSLAKRSKGSDPCQFVSNILCISRLHWMRHGSYTTSCTLQRTSARIGCWTLVLTCLQKTLYNPVMPPALRPTSQSFSTVCHPEDVAKLLVPVGQVAHCQSG